jgi:hypothetical protein
MLLEFQNIVIRLRSAANLSADLLALGTRSWGGGAPAGRSPHPPIPVSQGIYAVQPPILENFQNRGKRADFARSCFSSAETTRAPVHSVQFRSAAALDGPSGPTNPRVPATGQKRTRFVANNPPPEAGSSGQGGACHTSSGIRAKQKADLRWPTELKILWKIWV